MRRRVEITPDARRQIRTAKAWWRRNRTASPNTFQDELAEAIQLLLERPLVGVALDDPDLLRFRRMSLNRTHYYLYYLVVGNVVVVVALWHQKSKAPPLTGDRG